MKSYKYSTKERAQRVSRTIGCVGYHTHEGGNKTIYMPCKSHKIFKSKIDNKESDGEVTELVDIDGTWNSSSMPILDPASTMNGASITDKIIPAARNSSNPLLRGWYGVYRENNVKEVDMSKAFGYEDTKDMDVEDTLKYFEKKLGDKDEAKKRTHVFGKKKNLNKKTPPEIKNKKGFIDREIIKEKESDEMVEDTIFDKKQEFNNKSVIAKNLRSLKNMANKNGISTDTLIRMLKDEQ